MFAKRLKQLRTEKEINQGELAKIINSSRSKVSMWEVGKRDPNTDDLITLSKYFNVSIDYLLGHSDIRNPYANTNEVEEEDFDPLTVDIDIAAHNEGEFTEAQLKQLKELIKKYGK